jgi:hypothetical protein
MDVQPISSTLCYLKLVIPLVECFDILCSQLACFERSS